MTIQEAIAISTEFTAEIRDDQSALEQAQRIVLAAARAHACERCHGTGEYWNRGGGGERRPCPDCLDARKFLKEHAK